MFRKLLAVLTVLCCLASVFPAGAETLRGYVKTGAPHYQYVVLGNYPYEKDGTEKPVLWWILSVENGQALLFSEIILDVHQVIVCSSQRDSEKRNFRRITDYDQSDLYTWMNGEMLDTLLGDDPIRSALVETHNGLIYPLTDDQMLTPAYGFSAGRYGTNYKERRAKASPYAKSIKMYPDWGQKLYVFDEFDTCPYWVVAFKNHSESNIMMQLCGYDGHLSWGVYTRTGVGVRPALTLDLTRCAVTGGEGTAEDPFVFTYTGNRYEEPTP